MTKEEAKHLSEVLKAYSEGKVVQWSWKHEGIWLDVTDNWNFECNFGRMNYRIKSEPKSRPYANAEEFLKDSKEHGPYVKCSLSVLHGKYHIPQYIHSSGVAWTTWDDSHSTWEDLFEYFTWQDGHYCGIIDVWNN